MSFCGAIYIVFIVVIIIIIIIIIIMRPLVCFHLTFHVTDCDYSEYIMNYDEFCNKSVIFAILSE